MSYPQNTDFRVCDTMGRSVSVRRAEGQRRSENHCEQADCPLMDEFAGRLMEPGSRLITGAMGFGWLAGRANR
jgi:hypothetical protein